MTRAGLIVASIAMTLVAFSAPAHAACTTLDLILGGGGGCSDGDGGCTTYTEDPGTGTDSTTVTECSDGYRCEAHNHYNDPEEGSSTTFEPPGCENDPRQGI